MSKKCTLAEINKIAETYGLSYYEGEYKDTNSPIYYKTSEGYIVRVIPKCMKRGSKYEIFHITNPYTIDNIKLLLINNGIDSKIDENQKFNGVNNKLKFICDKHGEFHTLLHNMIKSKYNCPKCADKYGTLQRTLDFENCNKFVDDINAELLTDRNDWHGSKSYITLKCNKCNSIWTAAFTDIYSGCGCPYCAGKRTNETNAIGALRKDLIPYFKNASDCIKYVCQSNKKIDCICPECGNEQVMKVSELYRNGFSCKRCSDGKSIPEKFLYNVLSNVSDNIKIEYSESWSNKKRYDFYLPDYNMIIETHGEQHYRYTGRGRGVLEEQNNDILKERLAKENGIKNYIVIDCSKSDFDWLTNNIKLSLSNYLDFNEINWVEEYKKSLKSKVIECCELYIDGKTNTEIMKILNISRPTVLRYLKIGNIIGKITYKTKGE